MIEYFFLGLLQGVTEWLPVSSKAQVMIAGQSMGMAPEAAFDLAVFLHIGTVIAALIYFRKDLMSLFSMQKRYLLRFLVVSLLFTGLVGLPVYFGVVKPFLASAGENSGDPIALMVGVLLVTTGLIQWRIKVKDRAEKSATTKDSVIAGIFQGLAAMPGLSRSAMTTSALFMRGFDTKAALRLSFMMSIFAVAAADIGLQVRGGFDVTTPALVGVVGSFVSGLLSIGLMIRLTEKVKPWKFLIGFGMLTMGLVLL